MRQTLTCNHLHSPPPLTFATNLPFPPPFRAFPGQLAVSEMRWAPSWARIGQLVPPFPPNPLSPARNRSRHTAPPSTQRSPSWTAKEEGAGGGGSDPLAETSLWRHRSPGGEGRGEGGNLFDLSLDGVELRVKSLPPYAMRMRWRQMN